MSKLYSVFTGTGSYVPTKQITNDYFHTYEFFLTHKVRSCLHQMKRSQENLKRLLLLPREGTPKMIR